MTGDPAMDDASLVLAARSGDRDALAAIYDRYADRLHDYCWSILRDREEAADAFHDAFLAAVGRLDQLRDPDKLRPWLFAIARHEALRRAKARGRQRPTDQVEDMTPPSDPNLDEAARSEEAVKLVWAAAAGLADRDRALLDLNLRQGLDGQELAEAIGVEPGHAYVLLNRLRAQVERALGALLIARYGRADCDDLAAILTGWDGRFTPLLRKRVARHADQCEVCGERRKTLASPLALLGAMPLTPAPARLRDAILGDVELAAASSPRWRADDEGFPPPAYPSRPTRKAAALVAALVLMVGALAVVLSRPGDDDALDTVAAGQATSTTLSLAPTPTPPVPTTVAPAGTEIPGGSSTTTAPGVSPPTTGVPPTAAQPNPTAPPETTVPSRRGGATMRVDTTTIDFGGTRTIFPLEIANDGDAPLSWSVASVGPAGFTAAPTSGSVFPGVHGSIRVSVDRAGQPEGVVTGVLRITSDGGAASVDLRATVARAPVIELAGGADSLGRAPCSVRPTTTSIRATVTDETGVASVTLWGRNANGASTGPAPMTSVGGSSWTGQVGPFSVPGVAAWWVTATDTLGNTARSPEQTITVEPC